MRLHQRSHLVVRPTLIILIVLLLYTHSYAGIRGPGPVCVKYSTDAKRALVLVPDTSSASDPDSNIVLPNGRHVNVFDVFAGSGVYDLETYTKLWSLDHFWEYAPFRYSDRFDHLVRIAIRARVAGTSRIIEHKLQFWDRGALIKEYDSNDLLTDLKSPYFMPEFRHGLGCIWWDQFELTPDKRVVLFNTYGRNLRFEHYWISMGLKEYYTFDLASGDMLTKRIEGRWVLWAYLVGLVVFLCLLAIAVWYFISFLRLFWRRYRSSSRRGFPVD